MSGNEANLTTPHTDDPKDRREYDRLIHKRKGMAGSEFAGIGLQFALTIVLFALAGVWLDGRLGSSPLFVLLLVFGGGGLGFWSMYRRMMRKDKR